MRISFRRVEGRRLARTAACAKSAECSGEYRHRPVVSDSKERKMRGRRDEAKGSCGAETSNEEISSLRGSTKVVVGGLTTRSVE